MALRRYEISLQVVEKYTLSSEPEYSFDPRNNFYHEWCPPKKFQLEFSTPLIFGGALMK